MHFFVKYFLMFLFFSSAGWLIESLYCSIGPIVSGKVKKFKFINRGFLTGPLTPIYGVSCMVMAATLLPFKNNIFAIFFLGLVVCDCCCSLLLSMNCSNSLSANCSKCCPIMLGQAAGA